MVIKVVSSLKDQKRKKKSSPKKSMKKQAYSEALSGYLFLLPNFLAVCIFMLIPIVFSFWLSLTEWDLINPPKFVGLENYSEMLTDGRFHTTMKNTILFSLITIPSSIAISLFFALLLNQAISGVKTYQAIIFMPVVVSMVAVSVIWRWIFNTEVGILNYFLDFFGISPVGWISTEKWALISVSLVAIWKSIGFNMVIFLAGLKGIPRQLYEAADIDGAGTIAKVFRIEIPLLGPTLFFVTIMTVLSSFQAFDVVYMITDGGPGDSTNVIYYWIYQHAFKFFNMGYAAALSWVVFAVLFVVTLMQFRFFGGKANYDL